MRRLTGKTRRELLGALLGALVGAVLGLLLPTFQAHPSVYFLGTTAAVGAIAGGAILRRELGGMAYGAMLGAVLADLLWSNPKFNQSGAGILPGAIVGLLVTVIRELVAWPYRQRP